MINYYILGVSSDYNKYNLVNVRNKDLARAVNCQKCVIDSFVCRVDLASHREINCSPTRIFNPAKLHISVWELSHYKNNRFYVA